MDVIIAEKAAKLFSEAEREHDLDKMRRVIKLLEDDGADRTGKLADGYKKVLKRFESEPTL